ncbi:MAG TPA: PLP-dependent aminotransferase family protein [Thermoanaerobaculia bacterium]|nr:PLP-dependent aminotransferase family protein [Thermoanaerobaculia bacterium]
MLPVRNPAVPAYRWLYEALRGEILTGRLRPGARLPGSRDLARQYGLSRGTIVNAFEQLAAEGYVAGSVGSGTYVSPTLPEELLPLRRTVEPPRPPHPPRRALAGYGRRVQLLPGVEARPTRAFRANLPALDLFPVALWSQLVARRWRRATLGLLSGSEPLGYGPLREAVADYLGASRGVRCTAEQVAIVSGTQEALDLVARLLLDPGARVAMEDPGYIGATAAFEAAGARVAALPVDDQGAVLRAASLRGARLVYVTPAHQFPLGTAMSLARRLAMLDWARDAGALVFEDDYDGEYRYSGRPIPALQGLDRHGVVLFAGSFSKVLFPSLRLGYLVVPADLVERFAAAKSAATRHGPLVEQAVLCDFIGEGHFGRHLRRMREVYAERLGVLLDSARERLAGRLDISPVEAGLQTAAWLPAGVDGEAVARQAAARQVEVTPLARYARRPLARDGLHLGFAAVDRREIRRGVRELEAILGS